MADAKIQNFKDEVQRKISDVLEEFAQGQLNRKQFHAIYERYNAQLELADQALNTADIPTNDGTTIAIRQDLMGKAQGLILFASESGNVIETLGNFGLSMTELLPVMDEFLREWEAGRVTDRAVRPAANKQWLLFVAGKYSVVATLFTNEPSGYQVQVIRRMHREFEAANEARLSQSNIDAAELVYPFYAFVERNLRS